MAHQNIAPTKQQTVTSAIEDLDHVIGRGETYVERLQKICDRMYGPGPTELVQNAKDSAVPVSIIASVNERRSRLVNAMDDLERLVQSLENYL